MSRRSQGKVILLSLLFLLSGLTLARAQEITPTPIAPAATPAVTASIDKGDTAWLLGSAALVLLMTPGLACFYGGLVRRKNVLGTMMQSMTAMGLIGVLWVVAGYTLAFGPDHGHIIGGLKHLFLRGVSGAPNAKYASTTPELAFMAFQGMFAIITPALIGGAVAERMKFGVFFWFIGLWVLLVYSPLCHWVWSVEGWLGTGTGGSVKALDFAGGTVVHISSGFTALVACLLLGRRQDFPREPIIPHNLPLAIIGGGLLWFGWFGFNAGSALAADGIAANALVTTNTSAAAAALTWMIYDWVRFGKPTALGTISGAVAGLVGITPGAGFVSPASALAIGAITALCCAFFVHWRTSRGIDDSLDAFGVHGVGGTIGAILTGVFASSAVNPAGSGLIDGNGMQVVRQLIGVVTTYAFAGIMTLIILGVISIFSRLRVEPEAEDIGLDQTQHGETGYSF